MFVFPSRGDAHRNARPARGHSSPAGPVCSLLVGAGSYCTTLTRVELRQLRYFVTVADELNFGRAAERLRIAGPSLSQQIKALERDLKVQLFDRDRRSVALTAAGSALLPRARALIGQADELRRQALGLSSSEPVRIGYVQWCPTDWAERAAGVAQVRVDTWVMPSHAQAARVADGSLDLAICWVERADLARAVTRGPTGRGRPALRAGCRTGLATRRRAVT